MRLITLSLIRPTRVFPCFTETRDGWNTVILQLSSLHYPLDPTWTSAHVIALSPRPGWTHRRGLTYRGTSALFIHYNRPTIFVSASWKSREPPSSRKGRLYHGRRVLMKSHSTVSALGWAKRYLCIKLAIKICWVSFHSTQLDYIVTVYKPQR